MVYGDDQVASDAVLGNQGIVSVITLSHNWKLSKYSLHNYVSASYTRPTLLAMNCIL